MATKDNEKLHLAIVEFIFVGAFVGVDIWYSSLSLMPAWLLILVWVAKIVMAACVLLSWIKFKNPAFDKYRWASVILAAALALTIGIHHASEVDTIKSPIESIETNH